MAKTGWFETLAGILKLINTFRPAVPIIIEECGVIELSEPYDVSKRDAPSDI